MALQFMEGFDLKNGPGTRQWSVSTVDTSSSYQVGPISGSCYFMATAGSPDNGDSCSMSRLLPSTLTDCIFGFRWQTGNWVNQSVDQNVRVITAAGAIIAGLGFSSSTFKLDVRNAAGTVLAVGTTPIVGTGWHYIELRVKVNGASGEVQVYVDGLLEIATIVTNLGTTPIGGIQFVGVVRAGQTTQFYVDDIYVLDSSGAAPLNTFLGDVHIETIFPTADPSSGSNLWVPNAGSTKYTQVDDNPHNSDTDYISSATVADKQVMGHGNLPFSSGTVYALQTHMVARKDDAGTRVIKPVILQGGTEYTVGSGHALASSYAEFTHLMPLDPTGAAWTVANVNANEYGVELVT